MHKHNRVVFLCLLGMATCSFFSHPQLEPPVRTWTQLSLTLLLPTLPSLHPLHHHLPYPVHTLHHRSKRTRLTSICPNKRERSTETETPSCKSASLSTLHWEKGFITYTPKKWFSCHSLEVLHHATHLNNSLQYENYRVFKTYFYVYKAFFVIVSQVPTRSHGEMCALRTFRGKNLWSSPWNTRRLV